MKIAIVTDAWDPQVNGVVMTYKNTRQELIKLGHETLFITPQDYSTVPLPSYPSIRLALFPGKGVDNSLQTFQADAIHIATEGPLGHAAHRYCRKMGLPFTTSFHTQFPEYIKMRIPIPLAWSYAYLRRFHNHASCTMVPTESQRQRLMKRGFQNVVIWSRGVDTDIFNPAEKASIDLPKPIFVYMGRVAIEKNIEAFLRMDLPGSKLVIGDGPDFDKLKLKYPQAHYTGFKFGRELAVLLAAGNVFVFPSLTDTFGIVLLEAMACGLPVAAYPVTGPVDIVDDGVTGILNNDLQKAALQALELDPIKCIDYARSRDWRRCTDAFTSNLEHL